MSSWLAGTAIQSRNVQLVCTVREPRTDGTGEKEKMGMICKGPPVSSGIVWVAPPEREPKEDWIVEGPRRATEGVETSSTLGGRNFSCMHIEDGERPHEAENCTD